MARQDEHKYADLSIFEPLGDDQVGRALSRAQVRFVDGGKTLYRQDQDAESLFVLAEGRVKLARITADGRQLVVDLLGPGEPFGVGALTSSAHPDFAIALTACTVLSWSGAEVRDLVCELPAFGLCLLERIGRHLAEAHERMGELATAKAEQRVALALMRLARVAGQPANGGVRIELRISREDVAQMAGTTLYTVSRLMSGWERAGILRLGRQRVVILDRDELERHARG